MQDALRGYFQRRVSHRDVENLVDDTTLAAGAGFERRSSLHHYVFSIAKRKVAEHWRRHERRAGRGELVPVGPSTLLRIPDSTPGLESLIVLPERHAHLQAALAEVPGSFREVVELWLAGHDNVQIAAALSINYNTARSRLVRGKAALLAAYEAALGEAR